MRRAALLWSVRLAAFFQRSEEFENGSKLPRGGAWDAVDTAKSAAGFAALF